MSHNPNKPYEDRRITRIETKSGTRGHQVRFQREKISELFSDSKFGGREKALEAARIFRDAMEKMIDSETNKSPHFNKKVESRNISGHTGVYRTTLVSKKKKYVYHYDAWVAHFPVSRNKNTNKPFYIHKLGETEALRQALEKRKEGVENYNNILAAEKSDDELLGEPEDKNIKIWRYMDFTKFVSLLSNRGLYFPVSIDFEDQFEGSFSIVNKKNRPIVYKHMKLDFDHDQLSQFFRDLRKWISISCWHMNEFESAGMWSLYSKMNEAICIQSTYNKFRKFLNPNTKLGVVKYIDYEKEWIPENNILAPFLYKRLSFEHERELRAIINMSGKNNFDNLDFPKDIKVAGRWESGNLERLIEKIYVSPNSPLWFFDLVSDIVEKYGFKIKVVRSSLEEEPFY